MDTVSISFVPDELMVPVRIYANVDDERELLCATAIEVSTQLLQLPEGTWNVIIEIGQ